MNYENVYTYEYFLQENVCRFCWNLNAVINIFECETQIIKQEHTLLDKIHGTLNLNLTSVDMYPKKICESCYEQINKFYNFKYCCHETDEKLHHIFNNADIKPQIQQETVVKLEVVIENTCPDTIYTSQDIESDDSNNLVKEVPLKSIKPRTSKYKPKRCPTYCNICRKDFLTDKDYSDHLSESHGIEGNLYKCFGCDKRFTSRTNRYDHEVHHCKGLKKGYKCTECNRYFPSRRSYETHARDHRNGILDNMPEKLFKCNKCEERFDCKESLSCHVQEHDDGGKDFVCETCGRAFSRRDYLNKHMMTHTGTKEHVCVHCGYRALQKGSLNVHMRKHTGERPFPCDLCPQRCVSSSNLRAHRQRHLGVKKYECAICSKKFGYKLSLEEHINSIHEQATKICEDCGVAYKRARDLRRHRQAKHGAKKRGKNNTAKNVSQNNFNEN